MTDRDIQLHFSFFVLLYTQSRPNTLDLTKKKTTPNIFRVASNLKNMPRTILHHKYYFNSSLKFLMKVTASETTILKVSVTSQYDFVGKGLENRF